MKFHVLHIVTATGLLLNLINLSEQLRRDKQLFYMTAIMFSVAEQ